MPFEAVEGAPLTPGTWLLGRFLIESFVDRDGAVANYRGRDKQNKPVRIAVVTVPDAATPTDVERMRNAAESLERLEHPSIARVLASGLTENGDLAIVAEHVAGPTLEEAMRKPLGSERAIEIGIALLTALEAAHEHGIAHHDLAPARVRLAADASVVVTDMGFADILRAPDALFDESPTMSRGARYRAPEQARARAITRHADIYSVGAILYEVLTGSALVSASDSASPQTGSAPRPVFPQTGSAPRPVFPQTGSAPRPVFPQTGSAPRPVSTGSAPRPTVDTDLLQTSAIETPLAEFVARCLEKKPWNRYDTATLAREALEAAREAIEAAGPLGQVRLGELDWGEPQARPPTHESVRVGDENTSGLLDRDGWPTADTDASRPATVLQDIEPVAPIARPMVQYVRPQRAWWLLAGAAALAVIGIGVALWSSADGERGAVAGMAAGSEHARRATATPRAQIEAVDSPPMDPVATLTSAAGPGARPAHDPAVLARVEREAKATLEALAKAQAEFDAKARLDDDPPLELEVVEVASERRLGPATERARSEAEAQEVARIEAAAKAQLERLVARAEREVAADAEAAEAKRKAEVDAAKRAADELAAEKKAEAEAAKRAADELTAVKEAEVEAAKLAAEKRAKLDAEREAAKALAESEPKPAKKPWAQVRAEREAAAREEARAQAEAQEQAKIARAAKRAEAARIAAEAARVEAEERARRDAQWKARVEADEAARAAIEEKKKADAAARKAAREAAARKVAELEKAKADKGARPDKVDKTAPVGPEQDDGVMYHALLATVPPGASVLVDGAIFGKSPITLSWKPGTVKHVWVMLEGHTPAGFDVGDAQNTKMLRLELIPITPETLGPPDSSPDER